jgi:hypothetical protein
MSFLVGRCFLSGLDLRWDCSLGIRFHYEVGETAVCILSESTYET